MSIITTLMMLSDIIGLAALFCLTYWTCSLLAIFRQKLFFYSDYLNCFIETIYSYSWWSVWTTNFHSLILQAS